MEPDTVVSAAKLNHTVAFSAAATSIQNSVVWYHRNVDTSTVGTETVWVALSLHICQIDPCFSKFNDIRRGPQAHGVPTYYENVMRTQVRAPAFCFPSRIKLALSMHVDCL